MCRNTGIKFRSCPCTDMFRQTYDSNKSVYVWRKVILQKYICADYVWNHSVDNFIISLSTVIFHADISIRYQPPTKIMLLWNHNVDDLSDTYSNLVCRQFYIYFFSPINFRRMSFKTLNQKTFSFLFQNNRPAMFSTPQCHLPPPENKQTIYCLVVNCV